MTSADCTVAIVVLNHQRRELLLQCLQAARATRHVRLRIVVVDNGSTDGSADAVEAAFPDVTVLRSPDNKGVAGGRNFGARWVLARLDARFLLFIDNDTLLEPDAVGELARAADVDAGIGLVAPKAFRQREDRRLLSAGGLSFNPYNGSLVDVASGELDTGQFETPREIQACPGFAFFVRREVFERIGGFDEHFNPYGWEDADFSLRAREVGCRIVYAPRAVVFHRGGRAGRGAVESYEYHKARSMLYFVRRHTTRLQWICFLLLLPWRAAARIAAELVSRPDIVCVWLRGISPTGRRKRE